MSFNVKMNDLLELLKENWFRPYGIIIASILVILLEVALFSTVKINPYIILLIYVVTPFLILFIWQYSRKIVPKTKKNKTGFIVSIACSSQEERIKIKEDFIISLRNTIQSGTTGRTFHFMELPQHLARNIKCIDDANEIRIKCKAHFMLYGRVRVRKINGKENHVINLDGIVSHRQVPNEIKNKLSREFAELFPSRIRIDFENDIFSFEFTTEWIHCVSKYIIGIAAAMSGDLDYAEHMYSDVQIFVNQHSNNNIPVYKKLKARLPTRLAEIYSARAGKFYHSWTKDQDPKHLEQVGVFLEKVPPNHRKDYNYILKKSVYLFLKTKDPDKSITILKKCNNKKDPVWIYNLAFLYAYKGDLQNSIRQYKAASKYDINLSTLTDIEEFICDVAETEPEKYQLYFCLGYINWRIKEDVEQSIKDFTRFIASVKNNEFDYERSLAEKWIRELMKREKESQVQ